MRDSNNTLIDLLRHGTPEGGRAYRGHRIDDPLSEQGWQQMRNAVEGHSPWSQIVSSPMERCLAFARELSTQQDIPLTVEPELREVGFGDWEGKTPDQLQRDDPQGYAAFYRDPVNCRPAGAEPLADFFQRVSRTYDALCARYSGEHVLVVAHAGVIRACITHALGAPAASLYRLQVDTASISRLRHDTTGARLLFHNATSPGSLSG